MTVERLIQSRDEFWAAGFTGNLEELIPLLQYYQETHGYISPEGVEAIAGFLGISEARVYTVASFYAQFRFKKPGVNHVCVCLGTACHVQGGVELASEVHEHFHIRNGETTSDGQFDFKEVACLGCCAQAAVVEVNGKIYAKMNRDKLRKVLKEHQHA
ncbi:MAG TPA: NAD(P)H-dependent oxidoreductase subunit E [Anaerolineaceae bacterium]|nr:NAD(P)H-dependent oxidoreductase subunit E [Anaerolineaceae bacterium]HPC05553.1 NAD(P)H-dependent oxidoreductase subunit E [Anaerolineaceae bacterium]HQN05153.1 NAD(P)H-dependent oxidoreductase subunit E [Anaerolineaceae bacterium]HQP08229.1 NAD(P)H-dependent oxidoreductase subunit E [Anaerolineaceae bacterium]